MLLKRFIKFLKEEGAYEQYRTLILKQPNYNCVKMSILSKNIESQKSSLIMGAFTWHDTKEGCDFWREIHKKWIDLCLQ